MIVRLLLSGLAVAVTGLVLFWVRVWSILPSPTSNPPKKKRKDETCSLGVFLGSGGHTAEMSTLLSSVDLDRYTPRIYYYCPPDDISLRVIQKVESKRDPSSNEYTIVPLPRAREVGESVASTAFSAFRTLAVAIRVVFTRPFIQQPWIPVVDVLLVNGPGTCVVLVLVSYFRRFLGLKYTRIIYVESFARVTSLSLSGKILRGLVDTFVIQWPDASKEFDSKSSRGPAQEQDRARQLRKATYRGWLV